MADPENGDIESGTGIDRAVFFSDAAFVIAITLLVPNIEVPENRRPEHDGACAQGSITPVRYHQLLIMAPPG
jgi:uncharacterized membrane protein